MNKQDICKMIIGKSTADMQRFLKQYDYKFIIVKSDNVVNTTKFTKHNKQIKIELVNNLVNEAY